MQEVGEEFMKISDRGGVIYAEETANASVLDVSEDQQGRQWV